MIWIVIVLLVIALVGCAAKDRSTDDIDGGVRINNDVDAPKTINSTKIVSFSCEFSTLDLLEQSPLGNDVYDLQAQLSDGTVMGSYESYQVEKQQFEADEAFMEQLQQIVTRYDLAQYNGKDYKVSGLPDRFGARLHIIYESEEQIYASNNQDCFLPLAAMEELQALFFEQR